MSTKREIAKRLMQQYISMIYEAAYSKVGLHWDADNTTDINLLVDCLIDAEKEEIDERDRSLVAELNKEYKAIISRINSTKEAKITYRDARGALDWQPGDESAEDAIRRLRDEEEKK